MPRTSMSGVGCGGNGGRLSIVSPPPSRIGKRNTLQRSGVAASTRCFETRQSAAHSPISCTTVMPKPLASTAKRAVRWRPSSAGSAFDAKRPLAR